MSMGVGEGYWESRKFIGSYWREQDSCYACGVGCWTGISRACPLMSLRCFFSGRGRTPALPAFAPATIGVAFPFPLALCPLAPYVMPIGTAVPFTPCTASLECSRSRLTPRFGAAGSMIACEGVGVLRPGVNATVAAGVGILTLALGVGIDCGVPIPTGVRPRG